MRYIVVTGFAVIMVLGLSGCSSTSSEKIDYKNTEVTPTLEMPPNIIRAESNRNLELPGSKIGKASNTGRYVKTGNINIEARILPKFSNIHIQGQGDLHWISVAQPVEKVYPMLRGFWSQEGIELLVDEPLMGLLKTQWVESRAGSASNFFSRFLETMRSSESKYQYTTRVERSADDGATHIFVSHREQELIIRSEEVLADDAGSQGWQFRPADPDREVEMLSRLMVYLGLRDEQAKAEIERIGSFASRASVARGNEEEEEPPRMSVRMGFEQTWNRLRHQLTRLDIPLSGGKRNQQDGTVVVDTEAFYQGVGQSASTERPQLAFNLEGLKNADVTLIEVEDAKGSIDRSNEAFQILQALLPLLR